MQSWFCHCLLVTIFVTVTVNVQCISVDKSSRLLSAHRLAQKRNIWDSNPDAEHLTHDSKLKYNEEAKRNRRSLSDEAVPESSQYPLYGLAPSDDKRSWSTGKNMAVWGKRAQFDDVGDDIRDDKRKWTGGNMAVWGKRDRFIDEESPRDEKRKWSGGNMAVWGKRKWSSGNMAVWGKRRADDREEDDESLDEEKRKWSEKNMAVWG